MADAFCGPSNPLQSFRKQAAADRTLQQDHLALRKNPAESFRSHNVQNEGILDPEFEAFQAGFPPPPVPGQFPFHPPSQTLSGPSQPPAWAADFQRLHISPQPPQINSQGHSFIQQPNPSTRSQTSWHQDFLQEQPGGPPINQHIGGSVASSASFHRPLVGGIPSFRSLNNYNAVPQQSGLQKENIYNEDAFAQAFDTVDQHMDDNQPGGTEFRELGNGLVDYNFGMHETDQILISVQIGLRNVFIAGVRNAAQLSIEEVDRVSELLQQLEHIDTATITREGVQASQINRVLKAILLIPYIVHEEKFNIRARVEEQLVRMLKRLNEVPLVEAQAMVQQMVDRREETNHLIAQADAERQREAESTREAAAELHGRFLAQQVIEEAADRTMRDSMQQVMSDPAILKARNAIGVQQDYSMQLMILELENNRRLLIGKQENNLMHGNDQHEAASISEAIKDLDDRIDDYKVGRDQANDRFESARKQYNLHRQAEKPPVPSLQVLQDSFMQEHTLQQQNQQRIWRAQQEQDVATQESTTTQRDSLRQNEGIVHPKGPPLQDFQMQLMLLEQQNRRRLELARQEQVMAGQDVATQQSAKQSLGQLPDMQSRDLSGSQLDDVHIQEQSDEMNSLYSAAADQVGDTQAPAQQDEADDLAATAGQLLDSVADNTSLKFLNSNFLGLMRKLRDKEVRVEGDKMVDVNEVSKPSTASLSEAPVERSLQNEHQNKVLPMDPEALKHGRTIMFDDFVTCFGIPPSKGAPYVNSATTPNP
ncbi:MAG: hypothetical protein M1820_006844 [Bogoriella megaspora]|nr:MAG: hypothetical protein M1820_006844 [Bogoriella megaspora]